MDKAYDASQEALAEGVIDEVQSSSSKWPVRTGNSKYGFGYDVRGDTVTITNTQDYAVFVEERRGVVSDILRNNEPDLLHLAEQRLEKVLDG